MLFRRSFLAASSGESHRSSSAMLMECMLQLCQDSNEVKREAYKTTTLGTIKYLG